MAKSDPRLTVLEAALETEKRERADAEARAAKANERAREAEEAHRKLQLELTATKDDATATRDRLSLLEEKLGVLEGELARRGGNANGAGELGHASMRPVVMKEKLDGHVENMLVRIDGLRDLLAGASSDLSHLHAEEITLGKRRARILADACAVLARVVGEAGQAPPPLPSPALEARLSIAPLVDISEVAELLESLRPPKAPMLE